MSTSAEIALYYAWHIERAQLIAHGFQVFAMFFLLALWWHADRGWRWSRWGLIIYFAGLGLVRYLVWILYGSLYPINSPVIQSFILRTGIVGFVLIILILVFLFMDSGRQWIHFDDFSPEAFRARHPSAAQWLGIIVVLLALWSPFVPHPSGGGASLFAWGITTSFGITLTPSLLMLSGLALAGSRTRNSIPAIFFGLTTAVSSIGTDPITLHGAIAAVLGIIIALIGYLRHRSTTR
jgi:hypothetical protein